MLGRRFKDIRVSRQITQEDLADRVGISRASIIRYEQQTTEVDAGIVVKLAQELDVSTDYLLGLTDDPRPPGVVSDLSETERAIVAAVRRRDLLGAIRLIVGSE